MHPLSRPRNRTRTLLANPSAAAALRETEARRVHWRATAEAFVVDAGRGVPPV